MIHINKNTLANIDFKKIRNRNLKEDLKANNIYDCTLVPLGCIISGDRWAIDVTVGKKNLVTTYIYDEAFAYENDILELSKNLKVGRSKDVVKELALICAYIAWADLLHGTVFQTFNKSYQIAEDFIKVYSPNYKFGITSNWDETLEEFVNRRFLFGKELTNI